MERLIKTLLSLRVVLLALAVVGGAAQAQEKVSPSVSTEILPVNPADVARCPPLTGSRLSRPSAHGHCDLQIGMRVYGREELLRTGQLSLGEALRELDPSLNVGAGNTILNGAR